MLELIVLPLLRAAVDRQSKPLVIGTPNLLLTFHSFVDLVEVATNQFLKEVFALLEEIGTNTKSDRLNIQVSKKRKNETVLNAFFGSC